MSSGILGEAYTSHQLTLGEDRLRQLGLTIKYMPNALKGASYLSEHPEYRAEDLKIALRDEQVKGILCAIGGDDTYRTLPYLLGDPHFATLVKSNPKIFLGFSDTTTNHLMFYKLGLQTYYGQAFLTDFAELANDMLPYTMEWSHELLSPTESKEIASSPVWYEERQSFGPDQLSIDRISHQENYGHEVLRGSGFITGELLGGCVETLYSQIVGNRHPDQKDIITSYNIMPTLEQWREKILFVETSEEKPSPEKLQLMLETFDKEGIFGELAGILVGKPQDEVFYKEYKNKWLQVTERHSLPILYNVNIGHAAPRCILPYGGNVDVDLDAGRFFLKEPLVA